MYQNSGSKIEFCGSEISVSYKDSLNVSIFKSSITKYIQTMHIRYVNPRWSDIIKFNYRSFNFFSKNRKTDST